MKMNLKQAAFFFVSVLTFGLTAISCKEKPTSLSEIPDAQWDTTKQQVVQYCDTTMANTAGVSTGPELYEQSAAIMLPSNMVSAYIDSRIIKISVALANDKDNPAKEFRNLRVWVRRALESGNIAETTYSGDIELQKWIDVKLDHYLHISEPVSDLYIGYTITSNGSPILGDGSRDPNKNASYVYDEATKKWVKYSEIGNLSISCTFAGNNLPSVDAALTGVQTAKYTKPGAKFDVAAMIENTSNDDITSVNFAVEAGGQEVYNTVIDFANPVAKGEFYSFFAKDVAIPNSGVQDVRYYIAAVNGMTDDNERNNEVIVKTDVSDKFLDKVVLLENFTTQQCTNCARAHKGIEEGIDALGGSSRFAWICQHAGYGKDNYFILMNDSACTFYGSTNIFAPAMNLDRIPLGPVGAHFTSASTYATGPVFDLNGHIETYKNLTDYMKVVQGNMSPVEITETHEYDSETRELTCTVEGTLLTNEIDTKNLAVTVIYTENNIVSFQTGSPGDYTHNHVVRGGLTSVFGKSVSVVDGKFTLTVSGIVPEKVQATKLKPENMDIVIWVANKPAQQFNFFRHYNECFVHQSYVTKMVK